MKNLINMGIAIQLVVMVSGCATPRTASTDPAMRIFVDPDSLDKKNLPRLKAALQASGKWIVVEKAQMRTILREAAGEQKLDGVKTIGAYTANKGVFVVT